MIEDANHNFWIGGNKGPYFWDGSYFSNLNTRNSRIASDFSHSIKIDPFGNTLFLHGTGVSVFNPNRISNNLSNQSIGAQGKEFFDYNQNGLMDATNEPGMPCQQVQGIGGKGPYTVSVGMATASPNSSKDFAVDTLLPI